MADDLTLPASGAVVATDEVAARHYQIVKNAFGADGTATLVDATNPLPTRTPNLVLTGSISAVGDLIAQVDLSGYSTVSIAVTGTFTATLQLQASGDGSTWAGAALSAGSTGSIPTSYSTSTTLSSGSEFVGPRVNRYYRVRCTAYTSGTPTVTLTASMAQPATSPVYVQGGSLSVSGSNPNTSTDAMSASGFANVHAFGYGYIGGSSFDRLRTPTTFKTVAATASGSTAVWTPTSGKRFRLLRFKVDVTQDAAMASGGTLTVDLLDNATTMGLTQSVFVPAAAATAMGSGWTSGWVDLGNGKASSAINTTMNLNLSAALTAGTVRVLAAGTEE